MFTGRLVVDNLVAICFNRTMPMREEPREYPETQQSGVCEGCHLKFDDLTFVWYGEEGYSECPECLSDIWIEAPEPDWDAIAEAKAEALLERMWDG